MGSTLGRIAVLGGGVIGLSTALVALEAGHQVEVHLWGDRGTTTSAAAGASFKPAAVDTSGPFQDILGRSWRRFGELVDTVGTEATGVRRHTHWEASSSPLAHEVWLELCNDVRYAERPDVPGGYAFGRSYTTFLVDTAVYLPWLEQRVVELGGLVNELATPLATSADLAALPGDVVVNCTGFGSAVLFGDDALVPVKGQTALVGPRPDMHWSISADGFYVYPRSADTVLGGTAEFGNATTDVDDGVTDLLVRGNRRVLPDISVESVVGASVGIRPYRRGGVRIEVEHFDARPVVHNYGHGGAGVTLSWGSAELAVSALAEVLS